MNWIDETIRTKGYKISKPRKQVGKWIARHRGVFSAGEIVKALPHLDRVSVFRALDVFSKVDVIHPVLSTHSEQHYEAHGEKHHHHAVCKGCERSECVACTLTRAKVTGFTNLHHSVVFTGLCLQCK
ncbi:transcriptional repressor [Candidatus Uhrbacteria bacterium]|nr:transcriptional repressor [Candidatus Uhrbacteria bacterium]